MVIIVGVSINKSVFALRGLKDISYLRGINRVPLQDPGQANVIVARLHNLVTLALGITHLHAGVIVQLMLPKST